MSGADPAKAGSDGLAERLAKRLEKEQKVLFAYLFGSSARGDAGPLSDVDVAVWLSGESGAHLNAHLGAIQAVSEVAGSEKAEVVLLNDAPVDLGYRVIRDGRLLLSRDEKKRLTYWVQTVNVYLDMAPFRRTIAEGLKHRLEEGRFGRS